MVTQIKFLNSHPVMWWYWALSERLLDYTISAIALSVVSGPSVKATWSLRDEWRGLHFLKLAWNLFERDGGMYIWWYLNYFVGS